MGEFKRFTFTGKSGVPKMSVTRTYIGFNQAAKVKYSLDKYTYAVLFYDETDKRIGVKLSTNSNEEGAKQLQKHNTGFVFVTAKSFIDHFNLYSTDKKNQHMCQWDAKEEMLIADLKPI